MTDSMIERVAKALCHYGNGGSAYNSCCRSDEYRCQRDARKAIEAMRTPTEEMLYCGDAQISDWDRTHEDVQAAWSAMIDAALKEKPTEAPEQPLSAGGLKLTEPDPAFWWKD